MKMTSDLCEDVVVRLSDSQNASPPTVSVSGAEASSGVWGGSGRTSSAGVELGRRLLMAARAGDSATVMELLARGAPFASDWLGTSPLHLAAVNAHPETCAVLLRSGVSRDLRTKVDRTPLHLAASEGHTQVVQLLLGHGAQVDARDMLRMTPLHWAAQRGYAAVARLLLSHGADPNLLSKFYKTPHSLALERQDHEIVKLIEDAIKDREAAVSVNALFNDHMTETPVQEDQNIDNFESIVQTLKETSPPKNPKEEEKSTAEEIKMNEDAEEGAGVDEGGGEAPGAEGAGAQLLRRHGITLLPADESSTVLNAIQSGRTVVLSDAGKLMLKESESETAPKKPASNPKGVILTATPVKYPLKAGFKIFTLNNQFITKPKDNNKVPIKKIINPQLKQVKIVQMSPEAKAAAYKAVAPMKPKVRGVAPAHRPALKIIMNKSNFNKLLANSEKSVVETIQAEVLNETATPSASEDKSLESDVDEILRVREDFLMQCSSKYLRAHALAARRALAALRAQLEHANERLAQFDHASQICE